MEFYNIARKLKELKDIAERFADLHAYRYYFFVKNSDLGIECRYAKKSLELYKSQDEKSLLLKIIRDIRSACDILEQEIQDL